MSVVDEYLDDLTPGNREELEYIRRLVNQTVPDAEEVITYGMPGFKYKGKYLIAYGAFKDHCSLFPGAEPAETLQDQLGDYKQSKGTIQFTADHRLPDELIKQMLASRIKSIDGK
jgi:uncharacterized protein YdhG (YjbR/CyaY superfamily)